MGFFEKITALFSSPVARQERDILWISARCNRCGEIIRARVNLYNDLSVDYIDGKTMYYCHKQLIGEGTGASLCFQRIEVDLTFDERRRLIGREISGGKFSDESG